MEEQIRICETPDKAKELSWSKPCPRTDWGEVKIQIMYEATKAKFSANPKLKELLVSTGDAYIAEHSETDNFWGDGGDDSGQNHLGKILMKIRDEFKASK